MFNKKVKLYAVYLKNEPAKWLTLVPTLKEAKEFAEKLLRLDCDKEFKAWCHWSHKEETDENWNTFYKTDLLYNAEKTPKRFAYSAVEYNLKGVAAMLRMFMGCVPLGCSFDTDSEYEFFEDRMKHDPEFQEKLKEMEAENAG